MTVITMTREMGSRGRDVAIGLAERLDIRILHHELVEKQLADRLQVRESAVHRYLDGRDNVLDRWHLKRKDLDYYSASEIFDIAIAGGILIRGWGATQLLRPVGHVVSVRVCAPLDNRVETLMARVGIDDAKQARKEILDNDAAQESVVKRLSRYDWRDPMHYDIVLNTARVPIDECVEQVARLVELPAFAESPESRAALRAQRDWHHSAGSEGRRPDGAPGSPWPRRREALGPTLREERDLFV